MINSAIGLDLYEIGVKHQIALDLFDRIIFKSRRRARALTGGKIFSAKATLLVGTENVAV